MGDAGLRFTRRLHGSNRDWLLMSRFFTIHFPSKNQARKLTVRFCQCQRRTKVVTYLTLSITMSANKSGRYRIDAKKSCRARCRVKCREN